MEGSMSAPCPIPKVSISANLSPGAIRIIGFEKPMVTIVQKTIGKVIAAGKYIPDTSSFQDQKRRDIKPTSQYVGNKTNELSYEESEILFNES